MEPIRTVVYGRIYDPKSPLADDNGSRKDFVQVVKDPKTPVARWPGVILCPVTTGKMGLAKQKQRS